MLVFLYIGRDVPIAFMRELQLYEHALDEQAAVIQEKLRNIDISKGNNKEIEKILKNNLPDTTYSFIEVIPNKKIKYMNIHI